MKTSRLAACFCLFMMLALAGRADGQDDPSAGRGTVSREEFNELLEEIRRYRAEQAGLVSVNEELRRTLDGVRTEFAELKRNRGGAELELALGEMRTSIMAQMIDEIDRKTEWLKPGLTNFVIGGAAVTAFQNRDGADSTFGVGVAPTLLWKPMDRLLFETEIAFALTSEDTSVELDYAQFSYLLNDYLTIGAGKFLLPAERSSHHRAAGEFAERGSSGTPAVRGTSGISYCSWGPAPGWWRVPHHHSPGGPQS